MTTELKNHNNSTHELKRWAIQFILIILSIPYGLYSLSTIYQFLQSNFGEAVCSFISVHLYILYYLLSVYYHFKSDKKFVFNNPWYKSKRVYLTLFLVVIFILLVTVGKNYYFEYSVVFAFLIFFIFSVVYTWMLSEYLSKKIKSDRNLSFNFPIKNSIRFLLAIDVCLLIVIIPYLTYINFMGVESNYLFKRDNYFVITFSIILFFIYPFLILNFISELKNRKLNSVKNKLNN